MISLHRIQLLVWILMFVLLKSNLVLKLNCNSGILLVKNDFGKIFRKETRDENRLEFCRSITRAYYRNSVGVLLIYDTTNYVSFTHVTNWLNEARTQIQPYYSVFLLVGTKIDRESERQVRKVSLDFLRHHLLPVGHHWRRQSIRWFSQYIIYWNFIEIITLCARSFYTHSSRNLWYVSRRTYTCSKWVSSSFDWIDFIRSSISQMGWC